MQSSAFGDCDWTNRFRKRIARKTEYGDHRKRSTVGNGEKAFAAQTCKRRRVQTGEQRFNAFFARIDQSVTRFRAYAAHLPANGT